MRLQLLVTRGGRPLGGEGNMKKGLHKVTLESYCIWLSKQLVLVCFLSGLLFPLIFGLSLCRRFFGFSLLPFLLFFLLSLLLLLPQLLFLLLLLLLLPLFLALLLLFAIFLLFVGVYEKGERVCFEFNLSLIEFKLLKKKITCVLIFLAL